MSSEDLTFEDILKHIDRESEHFVIRRETHHHSGREVTVVEPHRPTKDESWLRELARQLKETLGTGGDVEDRRIVLHGDLRDKAMAELVKMGFSEDNIEVI
ncbi:translation initiation factor [Candidatus Bathyarchaeota archaeon]|nr:MAG: translation initiation factor [Candidatus Bathyarchaeota archaeon]TMI38454.1 MAG: translation initiation factor [Candidatus Bathyarchaeota archaeon]TMI50336.1 MAG: translation initiation factor [Candidatus Bathyarchaeota archaeon]TMI55787.1 MAG: translation initiation factor [Candidatus Bathyarchaeota archaeon]